MSLSAALPSSAHVFHATPAAVQPIWFRPLALGLVLALHAGLLFTVKGERQAPSPADVIEVSLAPFGDSAEDQEKREEIKPTENAPPSPPAEQAEWTAPPPKIVAPEAIPLPIAKPSPVVKTIAKPRSAVDDGDERPTPAQMRAEKRRRLEAAESRRKAQVARQEARQGSADGAASGALSHASYAALLAAEINRHKFYPAAARAAGAIGSVGVAFTVGPSGRVLSQSITNSSGDAALDEAARAIMSAVQAPTPPGGRFSTSTTIRFRFQ